MFVADVGLCEDEGVVGVDCTVGNPVLLGESGGAVDNELGGLAVVGGGGLHLHCIVAVAEFRQAEAPGDLQLVDLVEDPGVAGGVQCDDGAAWVGVGVPKRL